MENKQVIQNNNHHWQWIKRVLGFGIIAFLVNFIFMGVFFAIYNFLGGAIPNQSTGYLSNPMLAFLNEIALIFVIVYTYIHLRHIDKVKNKWLYVRLNLKGWKNLGIGTGLGILLFSMVFFSYIILLKMGVKTNPKTNWLCLIFYLQFFIIFAFYEEVIFRGYIFNMIKKFSTVYHGIFISSILFAVMHSLNPNLNPIGTLNIFLFGILLSILFFSTKSLILITGIHFIWNFLSMAFGLGVSGVDFKINFLKMNFTEQMPTYLTGGEFGPEGSIITSVFLIVLIAVSWYLIFNKGRKENG